MTFLQKSFNQVPVIKEMVYDRDYDDISLTINNWFIHEIEFQSKDSVQILDEGQATTQTFGKHLRKTTNKVLCNLTVDQLALLLKAADQSKMIVARSLSAIFAAVAPHLSTTHREEISHNSLRVKSYSVEDRDKELLLDFIERLAKQIKEM